MVVAPEVLVEIYVTVMLPVVLCEENAQNRNPPPRLARLALEREKGGVPNGTVWLILENQCRNNRVARCCRWRSYKLM